MDNPEIILIFPLFMLIAFNHKLSFKIQFSTKEEGVIISKGQDAL